MNNNIFINNLKQKNKQTLNIDSKYNPDVNQKYDNVINTRNNRDFEYSTTMWKPIIGSLNKTNITSNDLKIDISKSDQSNIKFTYEKELANRRVEQELFEKTITNNSKLNSNLIKLNDNLIQIDNNLIKIEDNFEDLKKLAINSEKTTIIDSITKLDDLLSSIKNL